MDPLGLQTKQNVHVINWKEVAILNYPVEVNADEYFQEQEAQKLYAEQVVDANKKLLTNILLDISPGIGDVKAVIESGNDVIKSPTDLKSWGGFGFAVAGCLGLDILKVGKYADEIANVAKDAEKVYDTAKMGTNLLPAPKLADHHIFPQQFKKFFESKGVDIHEFTITLGEKTHLKGVHGTGLGNMPKEKWNVEWKAFIEKDPTTKEIYQKAGEMLDKYNLSHVPIHPYKQ